MAIVMIFSIIPVNALAAEETTTTYYQVVDVTKLSAGDQIVIVAAADAFAMSTEQKTSNRGQDAVTKSEDGKTVTLGANTQVITLEAGTVEGTFAFNVGTGYLYAASSSSNHLKTQTDITADASWKIEITDGIASIVAQGEKTRNILRYNKSSGLFSCYGSGQGDVVIYCATEQVYDDMEDTTPSEDTIPSEETTPSEPVVPEGVAWTKVEFSAITQTDTVAITMSKNGNTWVLPNVANGSKNQPLAVAGTIVDNQLITENAEDYRWNIQSVEGGSHIGWGENYLNLIADNNGMRIGSSASVWSITDGYLTAVDSAGVTRYVGVYNSTDWRCYTSINTQITGQTLEFWKLGELQS